MVPVSLRGWHSNDLTDTVLAAEIEEALQATYIQVHNLWCFSQGSMYFKYSCSRKFCGGNTLTISVSITGVQ